MRTLMTVWPEAGSGMFEQRATAQEFLDRPDCEPELAEASYRFMETVNSFFGGMRIVQRFIAGQAAKHRSAAPLRILDIGSGSCDIPLAVSRWARSNGIDLQVTCLELADHAFEIARQRVEHCADPGVHVLRQDAFTYQPDETYDCAVSSMCFHHFSDEQILSLVRRLRGFVRSGVLINDLRRCVPALWAARMLCAVCGAGAGVRHDALLSIRRGFTVVDLESLLRRLPGVAVTVSSERWFRIAAVIQFNSGDTA